MYFSNLFKQLAMLKPLIIIGSILTFVFLQSLTTVKADSLPDLGSPDLVEYDSQTEQELGRAFTNALYRHYNLYEDFDTNDYIRKIGHKLASYTGNNRHYSFYVIDDNNINAFAGPNGVIGIHTGLITACDTEDELAAVIAHEISHVTQNHLSRRYEYSSTQGSINTIATLLAAILIGSQDPSAGIATLMGGMGLNMQQQLKNSRQHESEADAFGIQLLYKTGYNPHAMGDFFARLSKESQLDTIKVPEILRTHPVSEHRLAEAENRAQNLPQKKEIEPKSYLNYIKNRILHQKKKLVSAAEIKAVKQDPMLTCYLETLNKTKKGLNAPDCMEKLAFNAEASPIFLSALLQNKLSRQDSINESDNEALNKIIDLKVTLFPKSVSIPMYYSRLLRKQGKQKEAEHVLEQSETQLNYKYNVYMELSEYNAKSHQKASAYLNLAKAYLQTGNIERSKYFLKQAEKNKSKNEESIEKDILRFKEHNDNLLNNKNKIKE
ncbi:M48 family metalloprotease [Thiomicrorhabdus hydrogeniphila]